MENSILQGVWHLFFLCVLVDYSNSHNSLDNCWWTFSLEQIVGMVEEQWKIVFGHIHVDIYS